MENSQRPPRQIRQRLRKTAAKLVEDSSVRDELTDEQAKRLLKWGMKLIEKEAERTAKLPDEEALTLLQEKTTAVRETLLLVNKLVRAAGTATVTDELSVRLLKNMTWLTGQPTGLAQLRRVEKYKKHQPDYDKDAAFQLLFDLVQLDSTDEEE